MGIGLAGLAALAGAVGEARAGNDPVLYFSADLDGDGLYAISMSTGQATHVGPTGVTTLTVGLAPGPDLAVALGSRPGGLLRIDVGGGPSQRVGSLAMEGMAYDAARGTLYGTINGAFFTVDPVEGGILETLPSALDESGLPIDLEALAFGNGLVYALPGTASADTRLYAYQPIAAIWQPLGDTRIDWSHPGLAFDPCNGLLYAKGSQDRRLYRLSPPSAFAFPVGDTGLDRGGGLAVVGECPLPPCSAEDINRDGVVDTADVLILLSSWGRCPGGDACKAPGTCDGGFEPGCGGDEQCVCIALFDGQLVCHGGWSCGAACPDGTCPPGFHCVVDSCCGPTSCAPDGAICEEARPGAPVGACLADIDGDGRVTFGDLVTVLAAWGPCKKE